MYLHHKSHIYGHFYSLDTDRPLYIHVTTGQIHGKIQRVYLCIQLLAIPLATNHTLCVRAHAGLRVVAKPCIYHCL